MDGIEALQAQLAQVQGEKESLKTKALAIVQKCKSLDEERTKQAGKIAELEQQLKIASAQAGT